VPSMAIGAKRFDELSTTSPEPYGSRFTDPDLVCSRLPARTKAPALTASAAGRGALFSQPWGLTKDDQIVGGQVRS
jgi:hypothetical protein